MTIARRGVQRIVALSDLRLDPENPRLPEAYRGGPQEDLAVALEMGFEAFSVAQSIADNGFFAAEPLIVIEDASETGAYIVVEGNRRLTALLGLADAGLRAQFTNPQGWDGLAARAGVTLSMEIPVVQHSDRDATHVEVAQAHVVGKLQWRPYMQARFIAARVAEGKTIAEAADQMGITRSKAGDLFRDQAVVEQVKDLGIPSAQIEKAFSVLTVALSNTRVRNHIGVPLGSQYQPGAAPVPEDRHAELAEVVQWVFGNEDNEPVITDSRQMSQLGNVIASDAGLAALRGGATLEEAKQKMQQAGLPPKTKVLRLLSTAISALTTAANDLSEFRDDAEIIALVEDVEAAAQAVDAAMSAPDIEDA